MSEQKLDNDTSSNFAGENSIHTEQGSGKPMEQNKPVENGAEPSTKLPGNSFMVPFLKPLRINIIKHFLRTLLLISTYLLCVFSLYWGVAYKRGSRMKNLKMLVVLSDDKVVNGVEPVIGNSIRTLLEQPQVKALGNWHIYSSDEFQKEADKHHNTVEEEVRRRIHHQEFWASIWVREHASYDFSRALQQANASYNALGSIMSIFETGRDLNGMLQYVNPNMKRVEEAYLKTAGAQIVPQLTQNLTDSQQKALFKNANTTALLSTQFPFSFDDMRPFTDPVLIAPTQVGLIYIIILTFIQLNFFMPINFMMGAMKLKNSHYVIVKLLVSIGGYFILSLMYSFVTLAMQVDFTVAFGHSGFLVFWMSSFLTMCAVGGMNEVFFLICFATIPPFIGAWLLFWVISNVTPTFSPIALSAKFFRYGYAMPIHSSYEISKVVFFNTYKGALGRNYGILVAWNVIVLILLPPAAIFYKKRMAKKAIEEKQKVIDEIQREEKQ